MLNTFPIRIAPLSFSWRMPRTRLTKEVQSTALPVSGQPHWGRHGRGRGSAAVVVDVFGGRGTIMTSKCSFFITMVRVIRALKHVGFFPRGQRASRANKKGADGVI